MNLVSPERLIWLLAAIPIVIFYVLRTRLRRRRVSTLMFWDQIFDEKRQRSLWQNLRHWLSLLLQLTVLGLVIGALVDPLWRGQADAVRQVIIVLDNSASMQASETSGSRFDAAIAKAQDVVRELRDGDEAALVTAGSTVRVVVGMTDFAPAIRDALAEVKVNDGPTRVVEAIETARRLSTDDQRREVVVISDFCFDGADGFENESDLSLAPIGEKSDNVGITALSVRRSLVDPIGYAAMLKIQNFGESDVEQRLTIRLGDELVDVFPISIAAGDTWKKTLVGASQSGGVLKASIDADDGLTLDNESIAVLPPRNKIPVTLVSEEPSLYLESVLSAIPLIDLSTTGKMPEAAPAGGFLVLHRVVPDELPAGNLFIVDPRADCDLWKVGEVLEQAIVAKQETDSALMPHVSLVNVSMPGSRPLELSDEATPLLTEVGGATLMASLVNDQNRIVVLASDLHTSDLPLRIAFPVLMTNAVNWFLSRSGEIEPSLTTGRLAKTKLSAPRPVPHVWNDAKGNSGVVTIEEDVATIGPVDHVGLATIAIRTEKIASENSNDEDDAAIQEPEPVATLAVNLANADESDLRPRVELEDASGELSGSGRRSIWFYLTIMALGLVVGEWFLYQRRIVG